MSFWTRVRDRVRNVTAAPLVLPVVLTGAGAALIYQAAQSYQSGQSTRREASSEGYAASGPSGVYAGQLEDSMSTRTDQTVPSGISTLPSGNSGSSTERPPQGPQYVYITPTNPRGPEVGDGPNIDRTTTMPVDRIATIMPVPNVKVEIPTPRQRVLVDPDNGDRRPSNVTLQQVSQ